MTSIEVYLMSKQADVSVIRDMRRPLWNDIDVTDDSAVATFRRRRDQSNKRTAQVLGVLGALGGAGAGLGLKDTAPNMSDYPGINNIRKYLDDVSAYHLSGKKPKTTYDIGKGLLGAGIGGLGAYGLTRGLAGLGSWLEDSDIDKERAALGNSNPSTKKD